MKLLFATDLHGKTDKYERMFAAAKRHKCDVVINGGDMLPGDSAESQERFINTFLREQFGRFEKEKIHYLCIPGNDDLRIYDELLENIVGGFSYIKQIAQKKVKIKDYEFIGFNYVADYPFRLKDRCRRDTKDYIFPEQFGPGLLSMPGGFKDIDWFSYANTLPTIEEELEKLPAPENIRKAVYIIHMPPAGLNLDVCADKRRVGSKAVYDFIKKKQPLLTLHGHIHESEYVTDTWKASVGISIVIQPGQWGSFVYTLTDLKKMSMKLYKE